MREKRENKPESFGCFHGGTTCILSGKFCRKIVQDISGNRELYNNQINFRETLNNFKLRK